jgi:hypothetical protein
MDKDIACTANAILWLWKDIIDESEVNESDEMKRCWYRLPERQAYQNSIISFVTNGLIEDYDVLKVAVKIAGIWRSDRKQLYFASTGSRQET